MKKYKKQIYLFLCISLFIVIGSFSVLFFNFRKHVKLQNELLVIESNISQADSLSNNLLQIESDKRGFQLTNETSYLKNYYDLKVSSKENIKNLKLNYTADTNNSIVLQIDSLYKLRIANLDSGIIVLTTRGFDASIEFMLLKDKINTKELLVQNINILKSNLQDKFKENTVTINKKGIQNLTGLLLLVLIFILLMLVAARTFRNAQQKIIKNHTKFQEAQHIAKIGSWEWDIATDQLTWSQEQFRIFGQDRNTFDLTYGGYLGHFSDKEQGNIKRLMDDALQKNGRFVIEHEIIRKDGSSLTVFEQGTVLYDKENRPVSVFGTSQDITERKKVELEMLLAKKRFQSIFDNSVDGIYQSTVDGKFIMANPSLARIFDYESPEALINSVNDITTEIYAHPSDRERMLDQLISKGQLKDFEVELLTRKKEIVWVSESIRTVRNEKGAILYFEGTLKDISERKRTEEALVKAQQKFQAIFDNTADGIYQSTMDGKFIIANPSMGKIFGYDSPEELMRSVTDIGTQLYANPQEREKLSELIYKHGQVQNFELQVLTKSKSIIWVSANIRIVKNEKEELNYFEGTLEDITGRKMADEQLLNLSNRLQLALNATSIGIWDWDIKNNITVWDDEMYRIYNSDIAEVTSITGTWESSIHPDDLERVKEELADAINGEKDYDTEFRIIWKDKSIHYVKGNALVQCNEAGEAVRMIGTNADITERKESEEEILQLNENLDQFANITAHDLQEPIRMVSGFLGLLEKKYADVLDEQAKSYVHRAKDGADRMSILIKDLLEFSRSGNKSAKKEDVDLGVVMDLVNKDLSIAVADSGTLLNIPGRLPVVKGTPSAIYRLFLNLISNGIKFRKKDTAPEITLAVNEFPDLWEFTLQDNGIGVAEKDKSKLFQAFHRLHRRDEYPGTGLGLVTCKKIVETHGGKIWMTSELGKGTEFHFTINKAS